MYIHCSHYAEGLHFSAFHYTLCLNWLVMHVNMLTQLYMYVVYVLCMYMYMCVCVCVMYVCTTGRRFWKLTLCSDTLTNIYMYTVCVPASLCIWVVCELCMYGMLYLTNCYKLAIKESNLYSDLIPSLTSS